jgi:tripartite-type tricarboxylate transporter receptor subunit TctC
MMMTGVNMAHVPYRGGALALTDLLGGQVQVFFSNLPVIDFVKAGKLRALAVTTVTHSREYPDIPTLTEFVPGYEAGAWFGLGVRRSTPVEIIEKLNQEVGVGLVDPNVQAGLSNLGGSPMMLSPANFRKFIADETEKWGKVIKFAGIKPE